jgi:cell division septal protein FtsQ
MRKRVGANCRKRKAQRRGKRPLKKKFVRYLSTGVLYAGMFTAGIALFLGFRNRLPSVEGITDRLTPRHTKVESVVVKGTEHVTPEEIMRRSGIRLPVTLDELKREYLYVLSKTSPWIEKVQLMTAKKGAVTIGVVERKPVALVRTLAGAKVTLVDAGGVCMPLDPCAASALPLVSGLADSVGECGVRRLKAGECGRMNRFFSSAASVDSAFLRHITQAHFTDDGTVRIMVSGSQTVITIDEHDAARRLRRLLLVWEAVSADSMRPRHIDLSYSNMAFVSMKERRPDRSASRTVRLSPHKSRKKNRGSTRL